MEERLQKILSQAGVASRRAAEKMIAEGRISVNRVLVTEPGTKADPDRDEIRVDGRLISCETERIYILLHKPQGVVTTLSDPQGRPIVTDLLEGVTERVFPVGRLDYDSEGVLILTNDGEFSRRVAQAGRRMPKVYRVKVHSKPEEKDLEKLRKGIRIQPGVQLAPCGIVELGGERNGWYEVTLTEGKNRQIRVMFDSVGCPVVKLRRIRIGFLTDRELPVGKSRFLTPDEVERVFKLTEKSSPGAGKGRRSPD